ncbi:MAG: Tm-1-like ATP-binding domain-containing protein, partial [Planctomycetaceae bacterium]
VDVQGLNRISRTILARAAGAICGMVEADVAVGDDKRLVVASMFGNTTKCIEAAIPLLEQAGYEVLVFHATGTGGRAMEALVASGLVAGVLDVTTTELADELVGGVLSAGPERLDAASPHGVPAVVAPGCLDMVNFGERQTVPATFAGRTFYVHNPQVTLMRTTPEECAALGRLVATKVNASRGPVHVLIPRRAISVVSAPGGPFHDPHADAALFEAIASGLRPDVPCTLLDCEINDPAFARACVEALLATMRSVSRGDIPCRR